MPCRCGSTTHRRTTHHACPLNPRNGVGNTPQAPPTTEGSHQAEEADRQWIGWVDADNSAPPNVLHLLSRARPTPRDIRALSVKTIFIRRVQAMATQFLQTPSARSWYNLLALPTVFRTCDREQWGARLTAWPKVPIDVLQPLDPPASARPTARTRADALVRQQRYGAAKRIAIDNSVVHAPSEELHRKIAGLLRQDQEFDAAAFSTEEHPDYRDQSFASHMNQVAAPEDLMASLAKKLSPEAGMGPFGWSPQLVRWACAPRPPAGGRSAPTHPPLVKAMVMYMRLWFAGTAPLVSHTTLSLMLPIDKTNGVDPLALRVRPICMESLITRIICRAVLKHVKVSSTLAPFQLGVKSRGGVEPIIHMLHAIVEKARTAPTNANLVLVDFANAFNSVSRAAILDGVNEFCPGLLPLAKQLLANPTSSLYDGATYTTTCGTPQGNVLSPFLFSIGVRKAFEALKSRVAAGPDDMQVSYLDDVSLLTQLAKADVMAAWTDVDTNLPYPTRLTLNADKTVARPLSRVATDGIDVLGAHVGPVDTSLEFVKTAFAGHRARIQKLKELSANAHLRIYDSCVRDDLTFYLRTLTPALLEDERFKTLCNDLDNVRTAQFIERAGLTSRDVPDIGLRNISLPRRMGGAGLTPLSRVAPRANHAAALASWTLLMHRDLAPSPCPIPTDVAEALSSVTPEDGLPTQKQMVNAIHHATAQDMEDSLTINQRRLYESNKSPIVQSQWQQYGHFVPSLSDGEWQILCRSRLLVSDVVAENCPRCGAEHRVTGHYRCNYHYRGVRHDKCRDAICRAVSADFSAEPEPHVGHGTSEIRADLKLVPRVSRADANTVTADLRIVDADSQSSYATFVATANALPPDTSDSARVAAQTTAILDKAYQEKLQHYSGHSVEGVQCWIFTTLGATHKVMEQWLSSLTPVVRQNVRTGIGRALVHSRALRATLCPY